MHIISSSSTLFLLLLPLAWSAPFVGYEVVGTSAGLLSLSSINNGSDTAFGPAIPSLTLLATTRHDRLHVKIIDARAGRYEVPASLFPRPDEGRPVVWGEQQGPLLLNFTARPFSFTVTRASDGQAIFASSANFTFADQYWSLSGRLPASSVVYGLGESTRFHLAVEPGKIRTLFARDQAAAMTDQNIYGVHAHYLAVDKSGAASGAFLLNSNGMDVELAEDSTLTYKVIGGVPDFYFFPGSTPAAVTAQYLEVVGAPHLPPLWSLGFHQCRWGYHTLEEVQAVVAGYEKAGIPLQTMWSDIDYMDQYRDWTVDPTRYPADKFKTFIDGLHEKGMTYVTIVDPGISNTDPNYGPFVRGNEMDVWIREPSGARAYQGHVWPGLVYFPDFQSHPNATLYWTGEVQRFLTQVVPVDGLWIDMNEISNFCDGECTKGLAQVKSRTGFNNFNPNTPPYAIHNCGGASGCPLNHHTIGMDAVHHGGELEYNLHSLFGLSEAIATKRALEAAQGGVRSFVLSRSTFAGSGRHTAHWTGDNASSWPDLIYSVRQIISMNLFGIPMVGADICGFIGITTEELCARWIQLGSFYTFSRNHNEIHMPSQELYRWAGVTAISKTVLVNRYVLAPYLYTLLYRASAYLETVTRACAFEWPAQIGAFADLDTQFLVGPALLVIPALTKGATEVTAVLPEGESWFDWWTGAPVAGQGAITLKAPLDHINVLLRAGSIVPTQRYSSGTGPIARSDPFDLVIALADTATGHLFLDSKNLPLDKGNFLEVTYHLARVAQQCTLTSKIVNNGDQTVANYQLASIKVISTKGIKTIQLQNTTISQPIDTTFACV
jgi:alpha-glucosidase (family GH31 glycosyl hydrolase)